jgi:hypothetical protein
MMVMAMNEKIVAQRNHLLQSTFHRGDTADNHDDQEEVFWSLFQSADEEVASTLLAGRIAHMTG